MIADKEVFSGSPECLAMIPARGGSKRLPGKNVRSFFGKPIIAYVIQAALESGCFSEVMVSTDDEQIACISREFGAVVPFIRSPENSGDHVQLAGVAEEVLLQYQKLGRTFGLFCCMLPTAVFITPELIKISKELALRKAVDSVLPVVRFSYPIGRALYMRKGRLSMIQPTNYDVGSQDLEPAFHDAGQFYWLRSQRFLLQKRFFCENSLGIEIPESRVQDIDSEEDWRLAELKYAHVKGESHP
jgi:pseudaminic acid cytidylyltransferase